MDFTTGIAAPCHAPRTHARRESLTPRSIRWHRDPGASDLQRETRQQAVADAFVHKLLTPSLPLLAPAIADAVANEITTDAGLSIPTLLSTAVSLATHGHITTRHFPLPSTFGTWEANR